MSNFKRPSLTKDQLHDIGQRCDARDIPALLWEIARLRAVAMRADQLLASSDSSGLVRRLLREELDECDCVQEQQAARKELFGRDGRLDSVSSESEEQTGGAGPVR